MTRWIDYRKIWRGPERAHEDVGTVYAGFGSHIRVRFMALFQSTHMRRHFPSRRLRIADIYIVARFFMSIGSVIRTEGNSSLMTEAYARARRRPLVMDRHVTRPSE